MNLFGFNRVGLTIVGTNSSPSGLKLLGQLRRITTKQPTKATAAATKPDLYDDEDFENKLSSPEQSLPEAKSPSVSSSPPKREKWQKPSMKKWVKVEEKYPVHTCETAEEFSERKRRTFFRFAPDTNDHAIPPNETPHIMQLFNRGKGLSLEGVELTRTVLKGDIAALKKFWDEQKFSSDAEDQKYRRERELKVGPELAAAHFIVFRGGKVRFHGHSKWIQKDEDDEYDLPNVKVDNFFVKDINAAGTDLHYEGLENFKGCQYLESLNLSHCQYADNFFLDRICRQHADTLKSLDISFCPNISVGGITALCRLKKLQRLNVEGLYIPYLALACLTLEDEMPGLEIEGMSYILEQLDMLPEDEVQRVHSRLADVKSVPHVDDATKK